MRHNDADQTMATERYLLGEMSGPELDDFEEHMFECHECADAVKSGAAFTENARAVFRENPGLFEKKRVTAAERPAFFAKWFSFPQLATSFAALALLCVAGYQQFVLIPGLHTELAQATAPQSTAVYAVKGIARGEEAQTVIPADGKAFTLAVDMPRNCASGCTAEVRAAKGNLRFPIKLRAAQDGTVYIFLTRAAIAPGSYVLVLQAQDSGEGSQFPFRVE